MARRGSAGSVQTWDTRESERKKKKKVSLKPHKSDEIYNEQRKDKQLRRLMTKGKSSNLEVRMTKGKNLVFISDRVYVPESLRTKTMEYYFKKYKKQTPIIHLEKNFYWADMETDMRSFENEKRKAHFSINVNYRKLAVYH